VSEIVESDRLEGTPHPRETVALVGQGSAERALLEAYRSGRLHHAWIIGGAEGIGKATLAYRMAKFVLTNPDHRQTHKAEDLAVAPDFPAARQVVSQSHVDLAVLRRVWNDKSKSLYANIRVDDARRLLPFFGSTAGAGGWRIAIIDSADDMARESANALLKLLEEPPPRALFLLVSHQPGRLIATIRSRCRSLHLAPLSPEDTLRAARLARPDLGPAVLQKSVAISQGSVRRAIILAEGEGVALQESLAAILDRLPDLDVAAAHALADRCAGKRGEENFALILAFLEDWLHERVSREVRAPTHRLARWAEVWEKTRRAARDVEVFNLDRKPYILTTLSNLARVSRS
jgi:DNA polymerase-3 subunit delta'